MKKSANEIKASIKEKVEISNLILWGYTNDAKEFYSSYKNKFYIKGCVTEQSIHPEYLDEDKEIEIVEWTKYVGDKKDYIIVFATPFIHIENQILASGLQIFEEYIDSNVLQAILSNKKIAIMAGNCQIVTLCDFLREMKIFTEEYHLLRFSTHYWKSRWSLKSLCYLKNLCDLYICMRHEEGDIKFFRKEELPEECKIVVLPSVLLRLYWPQMKANRENAQNEYFLIDKRKKQHGAFEYGDSNINQMIAEGKDVEEIIDTLTSEDFYTKEQVEKHVAMIMRMLAYEEDGCDVKISSFIQKNYRKKMLYRDMTHMQVGLICEEVKQILRYLNMDTAEVEEMEKTGDSAVYKEYNEHCTEMPVYPSVAKHMGLQWYTKDRLYDVTFYNGKKRVTFEEYIRAYYSICSKMKQIQEEW